MNGLETADRQTLIDVAAGLHSELVERAHGNLYTYARYMLPYFEDSQFHTTYYKVLQMFADGVIKRLIVTCPPQHGKLLSFSTLIPTPNGIKQLLDIHVGDTVFGPCGNPIKVLWESEPAQSEYVVTFSDGAIFECHGNHEWVVYDRCKNMNKGIQQYETKFMFSEGCWIGERGKRGSRARFQVDPNTVIKFNSQSVIIDPYMLGVWLGDGNSSSGLIHVGNNDIEILHPDYKLHERKGTTTRQFYSSRLNSELHKSMLINNKHIPDEYIYNSVDCRKELIAGIIDTDGYVYNNNGRVTISNTNKSIIDSCALILRSLGQHVVITQFEPKLTSSGIQGRKVVYQLCSDPTMNFPTRIPRKLTKRLVKNKRRSIVSIEKKADLGYGKCIEVEGGVFLIGEHFVPTHNSLGSSILLPSYMLGHNPDIKIAIGSYAQGHASEFNREIQRIIDSRDYYDVFPISLSASNVTGINDRRYKREAAYTEIVNQIGSVRAVGRSSGLTGKRVDIAILDDLYKDAQEANSPTIRENAWEWYTKVVRARFHNDSRELIVFTRWHEQDLIGRISAVEPVVQIRSFSDILTLPEDAWAHINFEAIKTGEPTEIDPRKPGDALWPERHGYKLLEGKKRLDPIGFNCLYQGAPDSMEGRLYRPFETYSTSEAQGVVVARGNYTDTADTGKDYLCSICYDVVRSRDVLDVDGSPMKYICITDVIYTDAAMEETEITVAAMLERNNTQQATIESNNGGRGFARAVIPRTRARVVWKAQTANKESRVMTNANMVNRHVRMPLGWETRWPVFYDHITKFRREFVANEFDDAADALTGTVEIEIHPTRKKGIVVRK